MELSNEWRPPPPVDATEAGKRLAKIANGLTARAGHVQCRIEDGAGESFQLSQLLTDHGCRAFESDLAAVRSGRVLRYFPWDESGRLALKTVVLLNRYDVTTAPGKDRDVCLAAVGPERRSDPQIISIRLADLIVVNQTHRWGRHRWMWTDENPPACERLGIDSAADSQENTPAVRSLQMLDAGRIEEALSLYGVSISEDLHKLLGGETIESPACCALPDQHWTDHLIETLRQSAPWLLPRAVLDEADRIAQWADAKNSRRRRQPRLKLAIFPGQFHQRKASLMLVGNDQGEHPHLEIEATASNARLHDTAWRRPLEVDLVRHGVPLPPDEFA